jgi:hypothetical protein
MSEGKSLESVGVSAGSLLIIAVIVWFFSHSDRDTLHELEQLQDEVVQLRVSVQALRKELRASPLVVEPAAAPAAEPEPEPER